MRKDVEGGGQGPTAPAPSLKLPPPTPYGKEKGWQVEAAGLALPATYTGWEGVWGEGRAVGPGPPPTRRSTSVKVKINGKDREVAAGTVLSLLEELGLHPQGTVVERNREIVDREAYREIHLSEGDVLELVRLVGGG